MELFEMPRGWKLKYLEEIGIITSGTSAPQGEQYFADGKYPFVRTQDVGRYGRTTNLIETTDRINDIAVQEKRPRKAKVGSIVFPKSGASILTNSRAILGCDAYIVSHLAIIEPSQDIIDNKYLYYWLCTIDMSTVSQSEEGYPSLRLADVGKIRIPVPSLREQRRIVARIEKLTRHIDAARLLRRQAVDEISKILASTVSNKIRRNNDHWEETILGNILSVVQYGTSVKASREPKGFPVIRMGNIQENKVKTTDVKYIDFSLKEASRYLLQKDDILINRTNSADLVGKAGLFEAEGKYIFASYLIRLKVNSDLADPAFVNYCINSEDGQAFLKSQGKDAIGQTNINTKQIRQMPLQLPPLNEQRQIVDNLNRLQAKADALKHLQVETEAELAAFTPALLAKAFRGEL